MDRYSIGQILALLGVARASSERDWLMILVAFTHALRVSEVVGLKPDNIVDGYLIVQRLKGSKRTSQPLFEHTNDLLNERQAVFDLCSKTPRNQKLFKLSRATFWRRMQTYSKTAGLPMHLAHPHSLKHSILSQMIESATIAEVQDWGGHKSMASTGRYLHPTSEKVAAAARKALDL